MVLHVTIFILYAPNVQNNSIYTNINPENFIFLGLKSLDRLRGHPLFMSAHIRARAVSRTKDASGAAVGCPQSVESAVLRAFEDASRTVGVRFRYRISLPYRRSLFCAPSASENAPRTTGACFEHGTHIPYRRSLFPVPSPLTEASSAAAEPGVHFSRPHSGYEVATPPQR